MGRLLAQPHRPGPGTAAAGHLRRRRLIGAVEVVFAPSVRQRCLIHRAGNVLAKVPAVAQAEVKAAFWAIFDDIDQPPASG